MRNRRAFLKAAEYLLLLNERSNISLVLMFADLDNFKTVNDQFGHEMGDKVLRHFSDMARSSFRKSDILARYGGDEFVMLLQTHLWRPRSRQLKDFRASSAPGPKTTDYRPASVSVLLRYPKAKIILMISCARRMQRCMRQSRNRGNGGRIFILGISSAEQCAGKLS